METMEKIVSLIARGVEAELLGMDFVQSLDLETVRDGYNGIGPEFLDPKVREKVSELLAIFEPAALAHDLRNEFSDGTREGFKRANDEFLKNCLKLADYNYCFIDPRRYRARAVARILYKFVSAENFGWRAWIEAKERHEAKAASGTSAGETNEEQTMKKLLMMFAVGAAILLTGCSVTKVEYERTDKGEVSYRLYRNDHWLRTESTGIKGGMTDEGNFDFSAEGMKSSPSEEFNATMKTYGDMFAQLARLAAACYSPGTASIPLTSEAADANAVARLVEAQAQAKASEIAAKSRRETDKITAQADAAAKSNATATGTQATADCTDGSCTVK